MGLGGGMCIGADGSLGALAANLEGEMAKSAEEAKEYVRQAREEQLELACSKMVDKLRPGSSFGAASGMGVQGVAGERTPASAASTAEAKRAAKKEAASWGKGLAKGFFRIPKERKRRGQPAASKPPTAAVTHEVRVGAEADKENASTAGAAAALPPPKARKGDRCAQCDVRLPITACVQCKCRCGQLFCGKHMHTHKCTFDNKAAMQTKLRDEMPLVTPAKLSKIA